LSAEQLGAATTQALATETAARIQADAALQTALDGKQPAGTYVTSVAGKTGAVALAKADVGLGNVDNTSDLNKPISAALSWLAADGTDAEQTDGMIARESAQRLASLAKQKRPFFLATGFFRPHTPFVAPKAYFKTHPLNQIHLPIYPLTSRNDIPPAALPQRAPAPPRQLAAR
jgi:hypothetical protein